MSRQVYTSTSAKIGSSVVVVMTVVAMLFGGAVAPAQAATAAELQAQIQGLLTTIAALQAQLSGLGGGSSSSACPYTWTANLSLGATGADVNKLQMFLNSDAATLVASSGTGSAGHESSYFGPATKAAVAKFQNKYASEVLTPVGLTAGTGFFGAASRTKANALCTGSTPNPNPTPNPAPSPATGSTLTVAAAAQPANSLAPMSAARVPFTRFTVTASNDGDVNLNSVTVERTGLAADSNFSGIVLLDDAGVQVGLEKTLNSNHQATIGDTVLIPRGTSKTFTVGVNMKTTNAAVNGGEVASFAVVSLNTSATVVGSLPITGASHTLNDTLTIGSVTVTAGSFSDNASVSIGTKQFKSSSFRVTAGSAEKVRLNYIRWNQTGSAGKADLENVTTYVDGVAYPTTVSADGKYYTSVFPGGLQIDKGFSKEIDVRLDVAGGSARTYTLSVYQNSDLAIVGEQYGYGIIPPDGSSAVTGDSVFTAATPWYKGADNTIAGGSISVAKASSVNAQNIAQNAPNQVLGGFEVEVKGESVTVSSILFGFVKTGTMAVSDVTNVTLVDPNGSVVAGPNDVDGTSKQVTFSSAVTFPVGKKIYTLKGKIGTNAANNDTIQATTTPGTFWTSVTGQATGNSITPTPATDVTANVMTVKTANVTISVSPTPIAQTIVAGNSFNFANYTFDASQSGDDVKFTTIPLDLATASGTPTNLTGCVLKDGATTLNTGSNKVNPTAPADAVTFTFDGSLIIPRQTVKTVGLFCDVAATTTGATVTWGINSASTFAASGVDSGVALSGSSGITVNTNAGQLITINTGGSYTVVDDSTPGYRLVAPGQEVELTRLKFSATNETINLRRVALQLSSVASNTPLDLVDNTLKLYDTSGLLLGTAQVNNDTGTADFATSTIFAGSAFQIPSGGSKTLVVKGTISGVTSVGPLTASGDLLVVSYDGNANGLANGNYGVGVSSGTNITPASSDVNPTGVRIMKAYPTFAKLSAPNESAVGGLKTQAALPLYRFTVTANNGDVALYKFTFQFGSSTVSATTSLYSLYAFTDSGFSSADSTFSTDGLINSGQCFNGNSSTAAGQARVKIYPDATGCNTATTTYKIPSGQTRWFELRATVASVETGSSTESLSVQLEGDAAFPTAQSTLMLVASTAGADANGDLVWSPISTSTTANINNLDWTNGYGAVGLPTTNMTAASWISAN